MSEYKKKFSTMLTDIFLHVIPVKILFATGIILSFFAYTSLSNFEKNKLREKFFNIAEYQANMIQDAVKNQIVFLNSLHSFYEASENVSYDEFQAFVKNMFNTLDEITSVYWAPKVMFKDRTRFASAASKVMGKPVDIIQRSTSGDFMSAVPRDEYFPVFYSVPKQDNERLIGFDLATNYLCKEAIYSSVKSGSIIAAEKLSLLDERSGNESLFLFQPVYKKNALTLTGKDRFEGLNGLLVIALDINEFFKKELTDKSFSGVTVSLYDVSNPMRKSSIFSMPDAGFKKNESDFPSFFGSELKYMTDIKMAGRHYLFCCEPDKTFLASGSSINPILSLFAGIFISFLLSGFYLNIITRTKEIEKLVKMRTDELTQSEQKYRTLFETSKEAVILFHENTLIDFNTPTLHMFGFYSRSQLVDKPLPDFFNATRDLQEDSFRISEFIRKSHKIRHQEFEMSFRRFDGSVFIGEVAFQSFRIDKHRILQVKIKDITERKQVEKSFRETQQIIQGIFNNTTAVIYVKDIKGGYVLVNKQFELLFDTSNDEVTGKNDYHIFPDYVADITTAHDRQVIEFKSPIAVEEQIGYSTYLSLKFPLFDEINNVYAVCGMSTDITDRKNNEKEIKKFKTMADSANFALSIVNMDWSIHYINNYFASLHGYPEADELKGRNYKFFYSAEQSGQIDELEKHLLDTGGFVAEEVWHTAADGRKFPLLMNGVVIKDDNDKPLYMAFSAIDVSERKKIEEELIKTRKLESVAVLAGGIAHDFNNLLTSIIGNIELCKMDLPEKSDLIAPLVNAEKAAGIAKDLSQQLLTFTQNGAPLKTAVSIENLIQDTVNFTLKGGSDIKVGLRFDKGLFPVEINKTQISSVINNVILNSVHAMPKGGEIKISCENVIIRNSSKKDAKYLKISVSDTGIGIPEENLEKIFDPYFTTKEKTADKGSGLGLTTSYSIIKKHGGNMTARSVVGKGTTIEIFLPASVEKIKKTAGNAETKKDIKVFMVDNENSYRNEIKKIASSVGCEIEFAKYSENVFEKYKKAFESGNPFEAVILDSGIALEAIEKLIDINPKAKTIITSSSENERLIKEYDKYAANSNIVHSACFGEEMKQAFEKILRA